MMMAGWYLLLPSRGLGMLGTCIATLSLFSSGFPSRKNKVVSSVTKASSNQAEQQKIEEWSDIIANVSRSHTQIVRKYNRHGTFYCGASIISSSWVITAAHCMKGENINNIKVVVGEYDVSIKEEPDFREEIAIRGKYIHADFDYNTFNNDIALLKLEKEVNLNLFPPVCLPSGRLDEANIPVWITGWGLLGEDSFETPDVLHHLQLRTVTRARCEEMFKKKGFDYLISDLMLCAGGEKGKDGCQGDSGGPLTQEVDGVHQLVGLVSWGEGCARAGIPGVYTNVGSLRNWIEDTLNAHGRGQFCQ